MQISLEWLREWVDTGSDVSALAQQLTMAGIEIEGITSAAAPLSGVIVAEVLTVERHPEAEKLSVCRVNTGTEQVQIVCGAANVRAGLHAPLAQVGAQLPNGVAIKTAKLRGIESLGMLCSARELGLSEDASGLMELPSDLKVGADLNDALALRDQVLAINLTPNRGDCMSVLGIAREIAAARGVLLKAVELPGTNVTATDKLPVRLVADSACTKFAGRVIRGVRPNAAAPLWLRERLRRAGLRSISAVVDITNYVMLELGQPMHAYDLNGVHGGITVRFSQANEKLVLLDEREIDLTSDVLVVADESQALGLAGVMGGLASSITDATTDLFLEAAHFTPDAIAGRGRRYGLVTDASQRFERGVDPQLPVRAIERATQLILAAAGGTAGPLTLVSAQSKPTAAIVLRHARITRLLGIEITASALIGYLESLGMQLAAVNGGWQVTPPSWRFDIRIEEDLIEEVARLHGYDRIPVNDAQIAQQLGAATETTASTERCADALADRGYQEAITYSFGEDKYQKLLFPKESLLALANPISAELGVMRVSLWPGLALVARENLRRQQARVRLFEIGRKFVDGVEIEVIAGIAIGSAVPEQWSVETSKADFFDIKADVEAILQLTGDASVFRFEAGANSALHPGQSAKILRDTEVAGWLGALHPSVVAGLDLTYPVFVFELNTQVALRASIPTFRDISVYPAIRRDLAVIIDESLQAHSLQQAAKAVAGPLLAGIMVLSVYRSDQIGKDKKSMALGFNLQDTSRTLTDADADEIMTRVREHLERQFGAKIRDK